jgi:hypothetical protein
MNSDQNFVPAPPLLQPIVPQTPLEMLGRAIQMGANPETLERLLALQERWERNEARKAYDAAIAKARAKIPQVLKDSTVSRGEKGGSYKHETLAGIEAAAVGPLSEFGLWYRWRTDSSDPQRIVVTCIISHDGGYSEENSLAGPPDVSGGKNTIQAIGSTVTYLQRYTLRSALGLAAARDDDAAAIDSDVSHEQTLEIERLLDLTGRTPETFCLKFNIETIGRLPASKYAEAVKFLKQYIPK